MPKANVFISSRCGILSTHSFQNIFFKGPLTNHVLYDWPYKANKLSKGPLFHQSFKHCSFSHSHIVYGQVHKYMALDKLSNQLIGRLDKLRAEAQQRESEADKLVKDPMNEVDQ